MHNEIRDLKGGVAGGFRHEVAIHGNRPAVLLKPEILERFLDQGIGAVARFEDDLQVAESSPSRDLDHTVLKRLGDRRDRAELL
jgi:hypothetical protein